MTDTCPARNPRSIPARSSLDREVPYEWRIDSDVLVWGANAAAVLGVTDAAALASGRGYAQLVDPNSGPSRYDAVVRAAKIDDGWSVPYQVQYALRAQGERRCSRTGAATTCRVRWLASLAKSGRGDGD